MTIHMPADYTEEPSGLVLGSLLFLTSLCTLLLEIVLTRVLSVVMWYHFTFAVISISLLGIAGGAMHCYRRLSIAESNEFGLSVFWQVVSKGFIYFSAAAMLPVGLMTILIATPSFSSKGLLLLIVYFVACATPFYASGFLTALIFRFGAQRVSTLYAVDLLGASLGCLLAIPLLNFTGGIGSLLVVGLLAAIASLIAARRQQSKIYRWIALGLAAVMAINLASKLVSSEVDLRTVKLSLREQLRHILDLKWNSYSRLAILDYYDPQRPSQFPFLAWGLSSEYKGWLPRQYLITIDGASETPITELERDVRFHDYLAWDITSLPYHIRYGEADTRKAKALVIGSGGGRDLLTALYFGYKDITGVEYNQGIVDWMTGAYAEFAGFLFDRPEIQIAVDDGRNFVRSSPDQYDVLQISMIDTFAATAAGAYTLAENNLYTAEAFDEYFDHLADNGILSINRFLLGRPQQTLRIVTLAREALTRRGIQDFSAHIVVIKRVSPLGNNGLVMVKKSPFTSYELETIRKICLSRRFELLALPGDPLDNLFTDFINSRYPERFIQEYPFDIRPSADNWPFFFNTMKISSLFETLRLRQTMEAIRTYNFDAVFILFILFVLALASLSLFVFLPLLGGESKKHRLPASKLIYFVCVGLGFILIEIVLIQRFNLYLGHPIYSLAVILVSILSFSGIGSALTRRWQDRFLLRHLFTVCGALLVIIALHEVCWSIFLERTMGLRLSVRIVLAVAYLFPMGVCMGMPYPLGLRAISTHQPAGIPWVWAVNAAASVLGSISAFALAMVIGFRSVLLIGGLCYAGALVSSLALRPNLLKGDENAGPALPGEG